MRSVMRNKRMQDVPFWKRGAIIETPDCYLLVQMGCCAPADDECAKEAGMTPDMIRAATKAYERVAKGIHPDDYAAFDKGEMTGYDPQTGAKTPGPNAPAEQPAPPINTDDSEEDE